MWSYQFWLGTEALAEAGGGFAVTEEAEGAEVVEIALAAAFGYRADVVGVPEAAATGDGLHAVETEAGGASGAFGSLERIVGGDGVDVAGGADATVAGKDLVAEVARVGAKTPLVNAVVAAKCAAAFCEDFEVAPTAERQAVWAFAESAGCGAAAGEGARDKHGLVCMRLRQGSKSISIGSMRGISQVSSFWWAG